MAGAEINQASKTVDISLDQTNDVTAWTSFPAEKHIRNTIDFIANKDRSNCIIRIITVAMIRQCIMHVGIIVFGLVLLGVNARKKRSLGAMMKKSDRWKNVTVQDTNIFLARTFHFWQQILAVAQRSCPTHFSELKSPR